MEEKKDIDFQAQENSIDCKTTWTAPVLTKLHVEDAESGNNTSENTISGS